MVHLEPAWSYVRTTLKHRSAVRAVDDATARHLTDCGLRMPEFLMLAVLADELNATARPTDLACRLGLTSGGVTKLVDRCVARYLVRREPSGTDARSCLVSMTPLGQQRLEQAAPRFAELARNAIGGAK